MKNLSQLLVFFLALLPAFSVQADSCTYEVDTSSIQINWTAFKTTQKVAVQGAFTEVTLIGDTKQAGTLGDLLQQISAEVPIKNKSAIRTGNPARDTTLFDHFFNLFKKSKKAEGSIVQFKGNDNEGTFNLNLKINQKELEVPMKFSRDKTGHFEAKGGINLFDFGLKKAFENLHHTCEALHTGPDGVSKTWPSVEIKLIATISQKCDS